MPTCWPPEMSSPLKDPSESMEMMESQTLLLTLLAVKVRTEPGPRVARPAGWPSSAAEIVASGLSSCCALGRWRTTLFHSKRRRKGIC